MVVVEHDMSLVAAADWVIDIGPGSGDEGGKLVAAGPPAKLAAAKGQPDGGLSGEGALAAPRRQPQGCFRRETL